MKLSLIVLAFVLSNSAVAGVWSGKTKLSWLYPAASGFHFSTVYSNTNLSSCDGGTRFHVPLDHPNYDALVSVLLSSFALDREININIDDNEKSCSPSINRLFMHK